MAASSGAAPSQGFQGGETPPAATSASSQDAPPQATGSMASTSADAVLVEDSPTDTVPRMDGAGGIYGSPSRTKMRQTQTVLSQWLFQKHSRRAYVMDTHGD